MFTECVHNISTSYGLAPSLFLAGLVGGFAHCIGMCGPFVLAQTGSCESSCKSSNCSKLEKLSDAALLPYHLGRMTTYVAMAVLLSSVLNLAFLYLPIRSFVIAPMLFLAGIIFIVSAVPALGSVFPWVAGIKTGLPFKWVSKQFVELSNGGGVFKRYFLGVLLGFIPCGLVVSALMASATAPTPVVAGLSMAAFAAGTIPALTMVAFGGKALGTYRPRMMNNIKQGLMVISGLWLFVMAGLVLM